MRKDGNANSLSDDEIRKNEALIIEQYSISKNIILVAPIIKNNLPQLNLLAKKYVKLAGNKIIMKDLVGVGVLALIKTLNDYRSDSGVEFRTSADRQIRLAMIKEAHLFNASRKPRNMWQTLSNVTFLNVCSNCYRRCVY